MPNKISTIPGVTEDEIGKAVSSLVTSTPATELEDADRFSVAVRSLVEARAQAGWWGEGNDDAAVFVFVQYPRQIGDRFKAAPISNPIATKEPLLGRICFLNRDASTGRIMPLPVSADAVLEWLEDEGIGQSPVVMVYRGTGNIISRRFGAKGDCSTEPIRYQRVAATVEQILEALKHSHEKHLITPAICPKGVWEPGRSSSYIPGAEPEKAIQKQLQIVFSSWFQGTVQVDIEDSVSIGRIDIRLLKINSQNKVEYWMIVELKVIKSLANAPKGKVPSSVTHKSNVEGVCEGIRQAFAFAKNKHADAMLEIFDLRKDKGIDVLSENAVSDELKKTQPEPLRHVWPLYGSAAEARIAGYS